MPQDDPILAAVKRARGRQQAPPDPVLDAVRARRAESAPDTTLGPEGIRANDTDAVDAYLRQSESMAERAVARQESTRVADQRAVEQRRIHERRKKFGRPSYLETAPGAAIAVDVVKGLYDFGREAVGTAGAGYRSAYDLVRHLTGDPNAITRLQETEERGTELAKGLVTYPYHAVKHTREVTQRALAGEDVSERELGGAWAGGAMGLLGAYELGKGGVNVARRLRGRGRGGAGPATPPVAPVPPVRPRPDVPYELDVLEPSAPAAATPRPNPLSDLSDRIAQHQAAIKQLDAEILAREGPDALRALTDEELAQHPLGRTPPAAESFDAFREQRAVEASQAAVESDKLAERRSKGERRYDETTLVDEERRVGERRAPDEGARIQELLDEATRRHEARRGRPVRLGTRELQFPEEPPNKVRIGQRSAIGGPRSINKIATDFMVGKLSPYDVYSPSELDANGLPIRIVAEGEPLTAESLQRMKDEGLDVTLPDLQERILGRPKRPGEVVGEITPHDPYAALKAEVKPGETAPYDFAEGNAERMRQKYLDRTGKAPPGYRLDEQGKLVPEAEQRASREPDVVGDISTPEARARRLEELSQKPDLTPQERADLEHDAGVQRFGDEPDYIKRAAQDIREEQHAPGSEELHAYFESPEVQARLRGEPEPGPKLVPDTRTEGMPAVRTSRGVFTGANHGIAGDNAGLRGADRLEAEWGFIKDGEFVPSKPPVEPADLSALDARNAAQRAANERLEAEVERIPARPRRDTERTKREALAAERKFKRDALRAEGRQLRATIRAAERSLQRWPKSDTRPQAIAAREKAQAALDEAQARLAELSGEGGFFNLSASTKKAAPTAAQLAVRSKIGSSVGSGIPKVSLSDWLRTQWTRFMRYNVETSHTHGVAQRLVEKSGRKLPLTERPQVWMKAALDTPKRQAGAMFGEGPGYFDDAGAWHNLGPSLEAALKPIAGDAVRLQELKELLVAEHAPEYLAAGFKTGIDPAAAAEVVRTASPRVKLVAANVRAWLNNTFEAAVEAGAIPRELFDYLREKYPNYVPYEVIFPEGEGAVMGKGSGASSVRPPLRRVKTGSELPKVDPLESIPDYGARMIRYTDLYRAVRSTIELAENNRDVLGDLAVREASRPLAPTQAQAFVGELLSERSLRLEGDLVNIYNPTTRAIERWRLNPDLADGLRGLSSREFGLVAEMFGAAKSGVQFGVTNNPFFGLANFFRDNTGRPTVSEATWLPFSRMLGSNERFKAMGGGFGQAEQSGGFMERVRGAIPGNRLRTAQRARVRRAQQLSGTVPAHVQALRTVPELLKKMSVPFEEMTRGAEYRSQKALGLSDLEAYVNAQERLGNFAEHGTAAYIRLLNHTTPFFNPRIQGTRAFLESAKRNPGKFTAKMALTIGLPTLAIYALNYDDQEIQDLRQAPGGYNSYFLRDPRYYLHKAGYGPAEWGDITTIFRAPKPFLPGASGTLLEHGLDRLRGQDEHALRRAFSDLGNELWQTSMNPIIGVPLAFATNKTLGTGVPIVPADEEKLLPENQLGAQPNYALQNLSRMLPERARFSPAKAQYALGQFGGTMGREFPTALDMALNADRRPEQRPGYSDFPFVSRFFARTPTSNTAPVRDVYDDSRRGIQILETLQSLAANGDTEGALRVLNEHRDELVHSSMGQQYSQKLSQIADAAQLFANLPSATPRERRENRDKMLRLMTELARTFHASLHEHEPGAPPR